MFYFLTPAVSSRFSIGLREQVLSYPDRRVPIRPSAALKLAQEEKKRGRGGRE